MPKVIYIAADAQRYDVNVECGQSAMEGALQNMVPGIDGDCGGAAACGTCHVYVDPAWTDRAGPAPEGIESDMLAVTDGATPNSRLSCQIKITDALDGMILHMPSAQH